jgi:hypothetical protein
MEEKLKFIPGMPDELIIRARNILGFQDAVKAILRELMNEVAKSRYNTVKLWADVEKEAERRGIKREKDEVFSFDFITDTFQIVKITERPGG